MEEQLYEIRDTVSFLISWASGKGLGYANGMQLIHELYSRWDEGEMEEQVNDIREVIATLISWAAYAGLGYDEATRLLSKLYSGCEDDVSNS